MRYKISNIMHFFFQLQKIFLSSVPIVCCLGNKIQKSNIFVIVLKLGSHRPDKLHHPYSSPKINLVGTIKGPSSKLHRWRWEGRWISKGFDILIFIAQVYHPTMWAFFYVGKDVKIKATVMQIEKAPTNDRLHFSKVSWKFPILTIYNFAVIYPWNLLFS